MEFVTQERTADDSFVGNRHTQGVVVFPWFAGKLVQNVDPARYHRSSRAPAQGVPQCEVCQSRLAATIDDLSSGFDSADRSIGTDNSLRLATHLSVIPG